MIFSFGSSRLAGLVLLTAACALRMDGQREACSVSPEGEMAPVGEGASTWVEPLPVDEGSSTATETVPVGESSSTATPVVPLGEGSSTVIEMVPVGDGSSTVTPVAEVCFITLKNIILSRKHLQKVVKTYLVNYFY